MGFDIYHIYILTILMLSCIEIKLIAAGCSKFDFIFPKKAFGLQNDSNFQIWPQKSCGWSRAIQSSFCIQSTNISCYLIQQSLLLCCDNSTFWSHTISRKYIKKKPFWPFFAHFPKVFDRALNSKPASKTRDISPFEGPHLGVKRLRIFGHSSSGSLRSIQKNFQIWNFGLFWVLYSIFF